MEAIKVKYRILLFILLLIVTVTVVACNNGSNLRGTYVRESSDWFSGDAIFEWYTFSGSNFTFGMSYGGKPKNYSNWNVKGTFLITDDNIEFIINDASGNLDRFGMVGVKGYAMLGVNAIVGETLTFPFTHNGKTITIDSRTEGFNFSGEFEFNKE
jgi:hypothetical protein